MDQAILELCQKGHPAGFQRLVEAYQPRVFRTALAVLHSLEDARDITQEVFLRTIRALDSLDPTRPLWPWLRRVTVNLCLNLLRSRPNHLPLDNVPEPVGGTDPEAAAEAAWTGAQLARALATLPPLWRTVITLRHQEGLAYEEVARLTGLPLGTVKTYIHRGRRALRQWLATEGGTP